MFRRTRSGTRFEAIAAAWGALPSAVALMALNSLPDPAIFVGALIGFAAGGFLAGVRATRRRAMHGAVSAVLGVLIYLAFIGMTRVLSISSSAPDALAVHPSDPAHFGLLVAAGVLMGTAGAMVAGSLLASPGATRLGN